MTTAIRLNCKIEAFVGFEPTWPTRTAFDFNRNYEKGIDERFVVKTAPKLQNQINFMQLATTKMTSCVDGRDISINPFSIHLVLYC